MTDIAGATPPDPEELLVAAHFMPCVDDTFRVGEADDSMIQLVLESVVEVTGSPDSPRSRPFTLTFSGPGGDHLPQGVYDLAHPALGTIGIFLVPIGPGSDGRHRYEAIFN